MYRLPRLGRSTLTQASSLLRSAPVRCFASSPRVVATPISRKALRSYSKPVPRPENLTQSTQYLSGTNAVYLENLLESYSKDPSSISPEFRKIFEELEGGSFGVSANPKQFAVYINLFKYIIDFQRFGHYRANVDPLGLQKPRATPLDLANYGFTAEMRDTKVALPPSMPLFGGRTMSPNEIDAQLNELFCQTVGFEYMYIQSQAHCDWLRERVLGSKLSFTQSEQKEILQGLIKSVGFEQFLQKKFSNDKRFGLEGCEVLVPALNRLISRLSKHHGAEMVVMGMPHRGRLNVLANVLQKPMEMIFNEFQHISSKDEGSGDVKYHLGMTSTFTLDTGKEVTISLMANPSHLEVVGPVVLGKVLAEQNFKEGSGDKKSKVVPIILHGDASFAGQGVVYESFGFNDLEQYSSGGSIHVVVNNQIGFTTDPCCAHSSDYCTSISKCSGAPVLHVNADDVEAVMRCIDIAAEWRQTFHKDVIIDLVCYRRHGHNELEVAPITQPLMYQKIATHPNVLQIYSSNLVHAGTFDAALIKSMEVENEKDLEALVQASHTYVPKKAEFFDSYWKNFRKNVQFAKIYDTGVDQETLKLIGASFSRVPANFHVVPKLRKSLEDRTHHINDGKKLDWAMCEALAFGSLLMEGTPVRLSGQDSQRGTFSHRHAVLIDQKTEEPYTSLNHIVPNQKASLVALNSHLSELAVLAFELGYSLCSPYSLVIWEAQFGDFANGAQPIIDTFIASGEAKWRRQSGLTLLLPHGYEGMGPEHSSGRLERALQLCDDDPDFIPEEMAHNARRQIEVANMQVVVCSTPANFFHILRRQVHRDFRKPLFVFTPKSLLRHPQCVSPIEAITKGTRFLRLIPEQDPAILPRSDAVNANVKRLIFCSGKVYYDLLKARTDKEITDIALARVEQLSPFPFDLVKRQAENFPNAEIVWCQEEPMNMGAYTYVENRIFTALSKQCRYIGREPQAATAVGSKSVDAKQFERFISEAMTH